MRFGVALGILAATVFGAGWALRRFVPPRAGGRLAAQPGAGVPVAAIRRRPF